MGKPACTRQGATTRWKLNNTGLGTAGDFTIRIDGLRSRNLDLVEHRVLKRLAQTGIKLGAGTDNKKHGYNLTEDLALMPGLLFRTLALMRSGDKYGQ